MILYTENSHLTMYKNHNYMHKMRIMPDFPVRQHYGNQEKMQYPFSARFRKSRSAV